MFGHEIRKLVSDGVPPSSLYGSDLRSEYFDLGYKLFRDQKTLTTTFIAADIFDPTSKLGELNEKIDIIWAGSFLHLFSWQQQIDVCKRIVQLLKGKKGSMVFGRQAGSLNPGEKVRRSDASKSTIWRHDADSFKRMWKEVGEATGTSWTVEVKMLPKEELPKDRAQEWQPDARRMRFAVFRE